MSEVEALLREREGYVRLGKKDRVAQVDVQLAHLGIAVETVDGGPAENAARRGRKARG